MMSQSPQTRESKAESTLRSPLKIKNEPQTIATLTRNNNAHSTSRVRNGTAELVGRFSPSDTGKFFDGTSLKDVGG